MKIGDGKTQNYTALLLFLAGGVVAGVAVYYSQIGGRWALATAVSIVLMLAGCGLIMARVEQE